MLATALQLAPRYAALLQAAVDDFLPFVGPGEGRLHDEMGALLSALDEAVSGFTHTSPTEVEGKPVLVDFANTVDLGWLTLVQVVEEWAEATHGRDWRAVASAADFLALVNLFNAANG